MRVTVRHAHPRPSWRGGLWVWTGLAIDLIDTTPVPIHSKLRCSSLSSTLGRSCDPSSNALCAEAVGACEAPQGGPAGESSGAVR
mgnify:CR=1 FL=1